MSWRVYDVKDYMFCIFLWRKDVSVVANFVLVAHSMSSTRMYVD